MAKNILRIQDVKDRTGLSRSTIYAQIQAGNFPRSIPLGPRAVGWDAEEVDQWIEQRITAARAGESQK